MPIAETSIKISQAINNGYQEGAYNLFSSSGRSYKLIGKVHLSIEWKPSSIFMKPVIKPPCNQGKKLTAIYKGGLDYLSKDGQYEKKKEKTYPEMRRKKMMQMKQQE